MIKCRHCKEPFEPAARNQKYCNLECKKKGGMEVEKRRRKKLREERIERQAAEAMQENPNAEILSTNEKARKKKMSYGEYVHKYEPRKEPKKEVKPVESICDTCPVKKCNKGVNSCNRWARDFAIKWRKIQRRAGVHVDGKADQGVA